MVVNVLAVRRDSVVPPALIQGLEVRLGEDRFQEACDLVRADSSLLARVLAAGLPQLAAGDEKAAAAMEEFGALESIKMHARLGHVWLIAQLSPLFGLLGTVDGLIAAFEAIVRKGTTPRPIDLAGGIGTALVATPVGLGSPSWPLPSTRSCSAGQIVFWPRPAFSPSISPSGLPRRETIKSPLPPVERASARAYAVRFAIRRRPHAERLPLLGSAVAGIAHAGHGLLSLSREEESLRLPTSTQPRPPRTLESPAIAVGLSRQGAVTLAGQPIAEGDLAAAWQRERGALRLLGFEPSQATVVVRADPDVPTDKVQRLIETARRPASPTRAQAWRVRARKRSERAKP